MCESCDLLLSGLTGQILGPEQYGLLSSFHIVVNDTVKNGQEEVNIFLSDAHGRLDTEGLQGSEKKRKQSEKND